MKRPKAQVAAGVAAHVYGQFVQILIQLATLPIFLARWNAEQYGQWIVLSAIPTYLSIADFGIVTAAGNLMSMHRARGETDEVNRVFRASILIVVCLVPTLAMLTIAPVMLIGFGMDEDHRMALSALILATLFNVACGLFDSAYRPFGKYPKVTVLLSSARLVEWGGAIAGLYIGGTLTSTALGMLAGRATAYFIMLVMAFYEVPEVHWGLRGVDLGMAKSLLRSGVAFLSFPVGNMITLQGMVVLVGIQLGGSAVAVFNSIRTLARILSQLAILTAKAMSPEVSRLYGAGKTQEADVLIKQLLWMILPLTILGAIALEVFGPFILQHWSHGKIPFDRTVFSLLVVGSIFAASWQIRATQLTATNRHSFLALAFLVVSIAALFVAFLTGKEFGIASAAGSTSLVELGMVICTTWAISRVNRSKP